MTSDTNTGDAERLKCDQVLTVVEYNAATGFSATRCDGFDGFKDPAFGGSDLVRLDVYPDESAARAAFENGRSRYETESDLFGGDRWDAYDVDESQGGRALFGRRVVTYVMSGGPLEELRRDQARVRATVVAVIEAVVAKHDDRP